MITANRTYLDELRLVVDVPVSVDALGQQSVELLQRLHLGAVSFSHSSSEEILRNTQRVLLPPGRP